MYSRPTERTWIVTLVATVVSVISTAYLSIAFKEALRRLVHKSTSLINVNGAIALAEGSYLVSFRHPILTLATLVVWTATGFIETALLAPTRLDLIAEASGRELDLTSNAFEAILQQELVQSGAALVASLPQYSFGASGIFDFNGATYNVSTGGILPAAPGYGGVVDPVLFSDTGLAFAGGFVPTNLARNFPKNQTIQGLNNSFTLQQQGLTAGVKCRLADSSVGNNASYIPIPISLADGTTDYWLWAWNITSDCSQGQSSQQQIVTRSDSPSVPLNSSGFLASLVCPYPLRQTDFLWNNFTVFTNASWRYSFLPATVCSITPLITTSLVSYSNSIINSTITSSRPLGSSNSNLTQFLAAHVDYQTRTTQGLTTNSIGDALYSIYASLSSDSSLSTKDLTNTLLQETEHYWRGVIEFSGTFLLSAFSAYPREVPIEAQIPLGGQETVTTFGWYRRAPVWGYTIIPITVVALMTYAAVAYTAWQVFVEERGKQVDLTEFDPSDPIHLMMASSARDPNDDNDNLGDSMAGFGGEGIRQNELLRVKLTPVSRPGDHQRFRVTKA